MSNEDCTAKVVLSDEVWNQIKYFTENYDKEIGAVGLVKVKSTDIFDETDKTKVIDTERHFLVDKLIFPKQEVSTATVHITPEMWHDVIKEAGTDRMGEISFYWHKHPNGSPAHSHTDREDTFETFMNPSTGKQFYIFLQTSQGKDGEMLTESRIEMRSPIRATINNDLIKLRYQLPISNGGKLPRGFAQPIKDMWRKYEDKIGKLEVSDENKESVKEEFESLFKDFHDTFETRLLCNKIIKEKIVEPVYTPTTNYNIVKHYDHRGQYRLNRFNNYPSTPKKSKLLSNEESLKELFNVSKDGNTINNKTINSIPTSPEEFAQLEFKNGCAYIESGPMFTQVMRNALLVKGKKVGVLKNFINHKHTTEEIDKKTNYVKWKLLPAKKSFYPLRERLKVLFEEFNAFLLTEIMESEEDHYPKTVNSYTGEWDDEEGYGFDINSKQVTKQPCLWHEVYTDTDPKADPKILHILDDIEDLYDVSWVKDIGVVTWGTEFVGEITFGVSNDGKQYSVKFEGNELVRYVMSEGKGLETKVSKEEKKNGELKSKPAEQNYIG